MPMGMLPVLAYLLRSLFCGILGFFFLGSSTGENELHPIISLMTRIFVHRALERSHRNLSRPRLCVGTRIDNCELIEEYVRGGPREALDHTHLLVRAPCSGSLGHWRSKPASPPVKIRRFDH